MNTRALTVAILLTGAVCAAGATAIWGDGHENAAVPSDPPSPPARKDRSVSDQLLVERQWLDTVARRWIGPGYACAVAKPRRATGRYRRLLVFVADETAARRVRGVTANLASGRRALVGRTSPRFRMDVMAGIEREIVETLPSSARNVGIVRGGFMELARGDCPPVEITAHRATATPEVERWIADAVERFGGDRVVVRWSGRSFPAAARGEDG